MPSYVDMSVFIPGGLLGLPTSVLTQEMLDGLADELQQEGVQDGDTNGWISLGEAGAQFPIYIGSRMSNLLAIQNAELRADLNASYMGLKEMNPTLQRIGAARIIKNWRHVINLRPPRWIFVPNTMKVNLVTTISDVGVTTVLAAYDNTAGVTNNTYPIGHASYDLTKNPPGSPAVNANGVLIRIPTYAPSTESLDVTKGVAPVTNPCWKATSVTAYTQRSSTGAAIYEGAVTLHPQVMTEEVLIPVQTMPGMKLNPQNYFGEWDFVTGNDAFLGMDSCTGIMDPTKKQGRHFGEYRHACNPIHPEFARLILFKVCPNDYDVLNCS